MMSKPVRNRLLVVVGVTIISFLLVFGRLRDPLTEEVSWDVIKKGFTYSGLKENLAGNIKLGLDLRGGSHLILQVRTDDAIRAVTDGNVEKARDILQKENIPVKNVLAPSIGRVVIEMDDTSQIEKVKKLIGDDYGPDWATRTEGKNVNFTLNAEAMDELRNRATDQAQQIIENRVNAFGVSEPTIQRHGPPTDYQVLVQLPGVEDPERVKNLIRAESRLELKLVTGGPFTTEDEAKKSLGTTIPASKQVLLSEERSTSPGTPKSQQYYVVDKSAVVTGVDLRNAEAVVSLTGGNEYEIRFSLRPDGATRFANFTGANVNKQLAIVLNDLIKSAPNIQERIPGGEGRITGSFTREEAEDLALTLRSGALPAGVTYLEERTVGPSLGADSIRQGVVASLAGLLLVIVAMLAYYRLSGVNAVIALVMNLFLLLAALRIFGAVLTLPGIAGIALTIGMAVDANVLVFERIREELKSGKVVMSAVTLGFDRAFVTIFDSNITTIVAATFLFVFGTGPIRGFAVTLVAGLLANLFTAVFASKTFFLWHLTRRGESPEHLSI